MKKHCSKYFAYGSNLNIKELSSKLAVDLTTGLLPTQSAVIPDRDLRFTYNSSSRNGGVLDIVPCKGSAVPGMVFDVKDESLWSLLDKKEGRGYAYQQIEVPVIYSNGQIETAVTYEVNPEKRLHFVKPTDDYVKTVRDGLCRFNLKTLHLDRALRGEYPSSAVCNLFTYGTLMRGEQRYHELRDSGPKTVLLAELFGELYDMGEFPALRKLGSRESLTQGEFCLFKTGQIPLDTLDNIEGFIDYTSDQNLFTRTLTYCHLHDGRFRRCWVYIAGESLPAGSLIEGSDWRQYRNRKQAVLEKIVSLHLAGMNESEVLNQLRDWPLHVTESSVLEALQNKSISERKLAQITDQWCADW